MIKITNLNKYFYRHKPNEIHVIDNTTLEFPEHGLVTILGESGSGKTTLMNVIGGLDDFQSGSIEIDEFKIEKYNSKLIDRIRNEKVAYIFQNYLLLQNRTVFENLEIILNMYDISFEEKNSRIDYVLKAVGMLKYKKKNVNELSGGQQQRVAIARALIKSPSLILADEPTGNLDEKNTIQIMNIIKKISEKTLVILVSHEERIATSYSDYVIRVKDGKVVSNKSVSDSTIYDYEDDQNIYLKEYSYSNLSDNNLNIDFYSNHNKKINLKIVYEKGKFFIQSDDEIVLVNNESEIKLIDEHKKVIDTTNISIDNDYHLEELEYVKNPTLPLKEKIRLAFSNLNKLRKRTFVISIPLFIMILLVLFSVQSIISAKNFDRQSIAFSDSHIYRVNTTKLDPLVTNNVAKFGFSKFYDELREDLSIEPVLDCSTTTKLNFTLPSFNQISNKKYYLDGFSILSLDFVREEDLIYGRLPENAREIVVEKWVIENALKDSSLSNFMSLTSFINKDVYILHQSYSLKIVGIANNNENSVYLNKWVLFDLAVSNIRRDDYSIISLSEYKKMHPDFSVENVNIDECIVNTESSSKFSILSDESININQSSELKVYVKAYMNLSDSFDIIVNDELYDKIFRNICIGDYINFYLYCKNKDEVNDLEAFIEEKAPYYASGELKALVENGFTPYDALHPDVKLQLKLYSDYNDIIEPYVIEANKTFSSRILITITVVLISVIIVFFSMKSYAIKNIYDIGVYRAIGIKKSSIAFVYAFQVLIISLKSTLVGGFLAFVITQFIASIPLIDTTLVISFNLFIICTSLMIMLNILVGTIPVLLYMRLTPSKILTKYDI